MSNSVRARIRFLLPSEGGRSTPALCGVRPQLKLGQVFTSCTVASNDVEIFELGSSYEVTLTLMYPAEYGKLLHSDTPIELFEGSRLVARGKILE